MTKASIEARRANAFGGCTFRLTSTADMRKCALFRMRDTGNVAWVPAFAAKTSRLALDQPRRARPQKRPRLPFSANLLCFRAIPQAVRAGERQMTRGGPATRRASEPGHQQFHLPSSPIILTPGWSPLATAAAGLCQPRATRPRQPKDSGLSHHLVLSMRRNRTPIGTAPIPRQQAVKAVAPGSIAA
jgi:hypothetical protein